jgi:hypothetical protein
MEFAEYIEDDEALEIRKIVLGGFVATQGALVAILLVAAYFGGRVACPQSMLRSLRTSSLEFERRNGTRFGGGIQHRQFFCPPVHVRAAAKKLLCCSDDEYSVNAIAALETGSHQRFLVNPSKWNFRIFTR